MRTQNTVAQTIISILPIMLLGSAWVFEFIPNGEVVQAVLLIGSLISMFTLFGIGWVKEFPRWSIHSIGFCVLISFYLMMVSIPDLTGSKILGPLAFLPLTITMTIALLFNFSMKPLKQLIQNLKEEKNLLLYMFYGLLPLVFMIFFDENHSTLILPISIILISLTSLAIIFYLNSANKSFRTSTLVVNFLLTNAIAIFSSFIIQ